MSQVTDEYRVIAPVPRVAIHAFYETAGVAEVLEQMPRDRRMQNTQVRVVNGGGASAVETYKDQPTPNVIILESSHDRAALLASLDGLAEVCDAGTKVLVIGHVNDVVLYRELTRRGVSDYLIAPIGPLDVIQAISELFHAPGRDTDRQKRSRWSAPRAVSARPRLRTTSPGPSPASSKLRP